MLRWQRGRHKLDLRPISETYDEFMQRPDAEFMQQQRGTSPCVAALQLWALKRRGVCAQIGAAAVSHRAGSCWATHSQGGCI